MLRVIIEQAFFKRFQEQREASIQDLSALSLDAAAGGGTGLSSAEAEVLRELRSADTATAKGPRARAAQPAARGQAEPVVVWDASVLPRHLSARLRGHHSRA